MPAIVALFGALAFFWLSTRQLPLAMRALIWLAGVGLLAWAMFGHAPTAEFGLRPALQDAWAHRDRLSDAAIVQAFANNAVTVAQFIAQLLDFFLIASAVVGVLALLAFTRGERLEKALRPTILALFGFIAGSTATLAVVAIGLGGQVRPRTYTGIVPMSAVHDGDTFSLGEVSLRLWGVDAPELEQRCRSGEVCGERSRTHLIELLSGALVQCDQQKSLRSGRLTESFGRPLVRCVARRQGRREDVGGRMIEDGFAVMYRSDNRYGYSVQQAHALESLAGLMGRCMLRPDIWRNNISTRLAFESNAALPTDAVAMGDCSALSAPTSTP